MTKNILIIGAGIHGVCLAYFLKKINKLIKITIVDKNFDILLGSSSATHNRANRGFHYPRSQVTVKECIAGWSFFKRNFEQLFVDIGESYYLIEKKSLTSFHKYKSFLKRNKFNFKELYPNTINFNKKYLTGCFKVFEGCYDHKKLKKFFKRELIKLNINFIKNFNLLKVKFKDDKIILFSKKIIEDNYDIIVNATYGNVNYINKLFRINLKNKYKIQNTLIPIIETKKKIPGFTIMDGPYITIMPRIGFKNQYLIYDVKNSNSIKPLDKKIKNKMYLLIIKKFNKYIKIDFKYKFKGYLEGNRPVPIADPKDRRSTIIDYYKINNNKTKFIIVKEGKYISAAAEMKKLANKLL